MGGETIRHRPGCSIFAAAKSRLVGQAAFAILAFGALGLIDLPPAVAAKKLTITFVPTLRPAESPSLVVALPIQAGPALSKGSAAFLPLLRPEWADSDMAAGNAVTGTGSRFLPTLRPQLAAYTTGADFAAATAPEVSVSTSVVTVRSGDSLFTALRRSGLSATEAYRALPKLKGRIDAYKLATGDKLVVGLIPGKDGKQLASVIWKSRHGKTVAVTLIETGSAAPKLAVADAGMMLKTLAVPGSPSLPRTLTESGLPPEVCEQVVMALSRAKHPPVHGETLTIVYQVPKSADGSQLPRLRFASYVARDGRRQVFSYSDLPMPADVAHVDVTPATMVALWDPLPGARISSPFGWRIHPVFHVRLFHKGIDYEAAAGTPIQAAADGVIEDIGFRGNYGNYVRVRHNGRLETAYAHMANFAPGLTPGMPVHRGEVIGFVGATGVATGPHLYYEVLVDGRQIDPDGAEVREASRRLVDTQTAAIH